MASGEATKRNEGKTSAVQTGSSSNAARTRWIPAVALIIGVLVAYYPVWHGQLIWDDDGHITKSALRSWNGLRRIWSEPGAAQQYYPLVHTVFWVEHRLWGEDTLGYHLVNIVLHALSALLFVRVLKQLNVKGAWLAGALFAFHPVQTETVAWITELKNTLSTFFYLAAASVYLRFEATRSGRKYLIALLLFVLGLWCKTVIATLPAALLVVLWWRRGKLKWARDIVPTLPFFACGFAAGLFTAWVEKTYIGATGSDFNYTFVERCLIASRAIVFYAGKLIWPAGLCFNYPHWNIRQDQFALYIYPVIVAAVLALCWKLRRRWPGLLAAVLIFIGGLFPALGFFNVYPFRYSFVADHFQYLASLALIALVASAFTTWLLRTQIRFQVARAFCLSLLLALGSSTFVEAISYRDPHALWAQTLRRNPQSWLALDSLGILYNGDKCYRLAEAHIKRAMALRPHEDAGDYFNLAENEAIFGRKSDAARDYQRAVELDPNQMQAHSNLGKLLAEEGQVREALEHFKRAEDLDPTAANNQYNVGYALALLDQNAEAVSHLEEAVRLDPGMEQAHYQLATVLTTLHRRTEAVKELKIALKADPDSIIVLNDLAWALATSPEPELRDGKTALALAARACALTMTNQPVCVDTLAAAHAELGEFDEALRSSGLAIELAIKMKQTNLVEDCKNHQREYESKRPFRQQ